MMRMRMHTVGLLFCLIDLLVMLTFGVYALVYTPKVKITPHSPPSPAIVHHAVRPTVAASPAALPTLRSPRESTANPVRLIIPAIGIDLAGMDKSVLPGDDFNAYVNGGWIKATPIPADKSSYGAGAILVDETRKRLRALFQESSGAAPASEETRKIDPEAI